jgi:hypothetical protein
MEDVHGRSPSFGCAGSDQLKENSDEVFVVQLPSRVFRYRGAIGYGIQDNINMIYIMFLKIVWAG